MTAAPVWGPGSGAKVGGMQYAVEDERRSDITRKAGRQSVARLNFLSGGESDGSRPKSGIGVSDLHKKKLHSHFFVSDIPGKEERVFSCLSSVSVFSDSIFATLKLWKPNDKKNTAPTSVVESERGKRIGGMKNVWCKVTARANLYRKTEYQKGKGVQIMNTNQNPTSKKYYRRYMSNEKFYLQKLR